MNFYSSQSQQQQNLYKELLFTMGSLTKLFSDSNYVYLDYRIAENIFCKAFGANNLARKDCSADAKKNNIGIGIKTWVDTNPIQKIAEFNKNSIIYKSLSDKDLIKTIIKYRNERLKTTMREHGLSSMVYHCIKRQNNSITINECNMVEIDEDFTITKSDKRAIFFKDKYNEYSFYHSKSVLRKRFDNMKLVDKININIITDPFELLRNTIAKINNLDVYNNIVNNPYIILPLYSTKNKSKIVSKKSGLNLWNAAGRDRKPNEIYLIIPKIIRKQFPDFFPSQKISFTLNLPNGNTIKAKVCQQDGKSLMSNPNIDIGKWLLRDILYVKEGELITYELLEMKGFDSVKIEKISNNEYNIFMADIGSYEEFMENLNTNSLQ